MKETPAPTTAVPADLRAIVIGGSEDLPTVFEQIDVSAFRGFALFTHRPSYSLEPSFYDSLIVEMNRYVSSKISDLLTRFEFEEKWASNILSNIPHLYRGACVGEFFGAFRGYPGVIVSAAAMLRSGRFEARQTSRRRRASLEPSQ